ncbi:MAG: hypothetical protein QW734_11610 [Candidatus Bathyarchaeia archaeon]
MKMVVKTKEQARANFEAAVTYIPDRYKAGIMVADWLTPAKSDVAERNYADAVSKAVAEKRRQKAIAAMTNDEWKNAAITKGAPIIAERIRAALDTWLRNWGPMYDQVVSVVSTLPPKTLDWRANINNRLVKVVETWKKAAGRL